MPAGTDDGEDPFDQPVVMAGVGGSGTRVVAEVVRGLGIYIGDTLNRSLDNMWWTTLFSRAGWFYDLEGPTDPRYRKTVRLFEEAMEGTIAPTPRRLFRVLEAYWDGPCYLVPSLRRFATDGWDRDRHAGWGFKEPNALVYLRYHHASWPGMRYVHVVRNGLDMAWSGHPPMFDLWTRHHDIDPPVPDDRLPAAKLKWWVRANRDALAFCEEEIPDRHHVVRFEDLCREPRQEIERLDDFLGTDASEAAIDELSQAPEVPDSIGRHRDRDLSLLDEEDVEAVDEFGYEADHALDAQ